MLWSLCWKCICHRQRIWFVHLLPYFNIADKLEEEGALHRSSWPSSHNTLTLLILWCWHIDILYFFLLLLPLYINNIGILYDMPCHLHHCMAPSHGHSNYCQEADTPLNSLNRGRCHGRCKVTYIVLYYICKPILIYTFIQGICILGDRY